MNKKEEKVEQKYVLNVGDNSSSEVNLLSEEKKRVKITLVASIGEFRFFINKVKD